MIIARYLNKQILQITAALTFILSMVIVLGRFLKYLSQASQGEIDPSVLALLMSYRLPEFIQLILPLALLLGILLAYGRMYAENEMVVLIACGLSRIKLLFITLLSALGVGLLVAVLSLYITPWGLVNTANLLEQQKNLNEFDVMVPGVFQNISRGARTTYAENIDGEEMQNVFMYENATNRIIVAESGSLSEDEENGRFILFERGSIIESSSQENASKAEYSLTEYDALGVRVVQREINIETIVEEQAMSTLQLMGSTQISHIAELQWRISLIILIPVLTLLAVPLSKVSPRQGRFGKLIPAILLYILYFGLLVGSRDLIGSGDLAPVIGLWWVHVLFLGLGLLLLFDKLPHPAVLFELIKK